MLLLYLTVVCLIISCGNPSNGKQEDIQKICTQILRNQLSSFSDVEEACLMLMDVKTGNVLAQ